MTGSAESFEPIELENPAGPNLAFVGRKLFDGEYHDLGFLRIYETQGGQYVLRQRWSRRPGEILLDRLEVRGTLDALVALLKPGKSASAVRRALGMTDTITID
ncbi:hypothetical protein [Sphingosinithalassobacter portus]|uniref:hypothetical protein n=1 Tax=Stakelama portus TaxID=2676234 RepID=UPI000D6EAB71|nr:hypothetical protein [Sphingosinithalassobacter portus]